MHLRIGVHDDEPAHVVADHDVDDALVGQRRHDQVGERAQRSVRLERARELLADRRQQAQRAAPAPLGVVHACALERVGALLAHGHCELALVVVEDVAAREAESECADRLVGDPQRHRGRGRAAALDIGEEALPLTLVDEDRPAALDGLADRCAR